MPINGFEFICADCVKDSFLRKEIFEYSEKNECSLCSEYNNTIPFDDFSERIHGVLTSCFYQTSEDAEGSDYYLAKQGIWERPGQPIVYLIEEIAGINSIAAEEVRNHLSDVYDKSGKDASYEEQPYDVEAHYDESKVDTLLFTESWEFLKEEIKEHSRYFNQNAIKSLDHIFKDINLLRTINNEPVIQKIIHGEETKEIYRARIASSESELEKILKGLPSELGPPPHKVAKAGRMNADGISVFYGALSKDTCIAEIRAPVGSAIVIGKFIPMRTLRLLNFIRLKETFVVGSVFDPDIIEDRSRAKFLDKLISELSAPIQPGTENHDYLPTQMVVEYFSQLKELNLDGVLFASSQTNAIGENIVLFNHASKIDLYDLPDDAEVSVSLGYATDDEYENDITIWERIPENSDKKKDSQSEALNLKLDISSVEVLMIDGVKYNYSGRCISRYRYEGDEILPHEFDMPFF